MSHKRIQRKAGPGENIGGGLKYELFGLGVDPGDVDAAAGFVEDLDGAGVGRFGRGGLEEEEAGEEAYHCYYGLSCGGWWLLVFTWLCVRFALRHFFSPIFC